MPTAFVVTGFSSFYGVEANPTQHIVENLPAFLCRRGSPLECGAQLLSCSVLDVTAKTTDAWLQSAASLLCSQPGADEQEVVWVHFGVDVRGSGFKLEARAANEATFRCPDQAGWQPCRQLIDDSNGHTLASCLYSDLPLEGIAGMLREAGHCCAVSADAGLFVCNYTYYRSLQQCAAQPAGRWHSLFVHVPDASRVALPSQVAFAAAVLDALALALAGSDAGQPADARAAAEQTAPLPLPAALIEQQQALAALA